MVSYNTPTKQTSLKRGLALVAFLAATVVPSTQAFTTVQPKTPLMPATPAAAAHHQGHKVPASLLVSKPSTISTTSSTARSMTMDDVNTFYSTYPLQAAVLTCGVKASLADCVAQVRSWTESEHAIEMRRNAAYIIYGGIFIGFMCHMEYDFIFPQIFGTAHDVQTIASEVLFDNFISAPLMWLPPAYFIKAIIYGYPMKEGLDRYVTDVKEGLLLKYWAIWLPAQTISFSFVPDHLRIVFMACVSFGWFIIMSSAQSQTDNAANANAAIEASAVDAEEKLALVKSS